MEKWISVRAGALWGGVVAAIIIVAVLALTQSG
jgi:hypothetical protein